MTARAGGDAGGPPRVEAAEAVLPTIDLAADMAELTALGFRLETIHPADDPAVAVMTGHGARVRLERGAGAPGALRLTGAPAGARVLPGGTRVTVAPAPRMEVPPVRPALHVRRLADGAPWVIGRAGMAYRDLVPDRLGGSIIASHIRIPGGGPVPDMVHYHTVGFQLIFCHRGWVDLVYEDQGPPFRLHAGCCVTQPPEIRHRVIEASDGIEVIEIGVPAEHVTTIDHAMTLPNGPADPERRFGGQRFVHHVEEGAAWRPFRVPGFQARDTGIAAATNGVAGVEVVRPDGAPAAAAAHGADILFGFVRAGTMRLEVAGRDPEPLEEGDAFTLPPGLVARYADPSAGFELLEVALPGPAPTRLEG